VFFGKQEKFFNNGPYLFKGDAELAFFLRLESCTIEGFREWAINHEGTSRRLFQLV
jgi:hypothetical protein